MLGASEWHIINWIAFQLANERRLLSPYHSGVTLNVFPIQGTSWSVCLLVVCLFVFDAVSILTDHSSELIVVVTVAGRCFIWID